MNKNNFSTKILIIFLLVLVCASCQSKEFQPQILFDFETDSELDLLSWKCGTMMERVKLHATSGQFSLRLEMYENAEYPGFGATINESWVGAGKVMFDIFNPASAMTLSYRIDDKADPAYADRVNGRLLVKPGKNTFTFDLSTIQTSGTERKPDLSTIRNLLLFVHRPEEKITLYLDNIRLLR